MNGIESAEGFLCVLGLMQGECLSPTLFSFLVNYMVGYLHEYLKGDVLSWNEVQLYLMLYTDDSLFLSDNAVSFQNGINAIHDYCSLWNLQLNTEKTKIVVFRHFNCRLDNNMSFKYGNVPLEIVDSMEYLGCLVHYSGKWSRNYEVRTRKANRAMGCLKQRLYHFCFPPAASFKLYNSLVDSVLLYGAEAWGYKCPCTINNLQLQFIKETLCLKRITTSYFVWGDTGLLPTEFMAWYRVLCYWGSLVYYKCSKFSKRVYEQLKLEPGNTWASFVRHKLMQIGLGEYWESQVVRNQREFKNKAKTGLYNLLKANTLASFTTGKSICYRHLYEAKEPWQMAWYIKYSICQNVYRPIASIRMRSNRLAVEVGSWSGRQSGRIDYVDRKCVQCECLEDEFHFIYECSLYTDIRRKYITKYQQGNYSMATLVKLLCTPDIKICNNLGN